jgi:ATP-dependent RNA helicase DeaD
MLAAIEKATRQKIEPLELPSTEMVNNKRIAAFKQSISDTLAAGELDFMQGILDQYQQEHDVPALEIAAALAKLSIGDRALLLQPEKKKPARSSAEPGQRKERGERKGKPQSRPIQEGMQRFRIEVGHQHKVKPGNIVGAIANEAGLDASTREKENRRAHSRKEEAEETEEENSEEETSQEETGEEKETSSWLGFWSLY